MFKLMSEDEGIVPVGKRAGEFNRIAGLLRAIGFGLILPHIFYVNDLSHPLQTGLLFCLFPTGILIGRWIFRASTRAPLLQTVLMTLTYFLIAASAIALPIGIGSLRLAQLAIFLMGLFTASTGGQSRFEMPILGLSVGALLSGLLAWSHIRSNERYDLSELMMPALAAAVVSALALLFSRRAGSIESETFADAGVNRQAICAIGISAFTALAAAIVCTLTPMMLWETFAFGPSATSLVFAKAGLVICCVNLVAGRVLRISDSAFRTNVIGGLGLAFLGIGAAALMWAPSTQSGLLVFSGVAAFSIGWGVWQPVRFRITRGLLAGRPGEAILKLNDLAVLLAWIVGPILSASVFYAHERTSFGLAGLAIISAAVFFGATPRRSKQA
jgi:hypothetical protein